MALTTLVNRMAAFTAMKKNAPTQDTASGFRKSKLLNLSILGILYAMASNLLKLSKIQNSIGVFSITRMECGQLIFLVLVVVSINILLQNMILLLMRLNGRKRIKHQILLLLRIQLRLLHLLLQMLTFN